MSGVPEDKGTHDTSDACQTDNPDPVAQVSPVSSGPSPSGTLPRRKEVSSTTASISILAEDPGLPSLSAAQAMRRYDLGGSRGSHAGLRGPEAATGQAPWALVTGKEATLAKPTKGSVRGRGGVDIGGATQTMGPATHRGMKQPSREEPAQAPPELHRPQRPVPLAPFSPRPQPSSCCRSPTSAWCRASGICLALRSRAIRPIAGLRNPQSWPDPAFCSPTSRPEPAVCILSTPPSQWSLCTITNPPDPALRSRHSWPDQALGILATTPVSALRNHPFWRGLALHISATPPDPALHSPPFWRAPSLPIVATPPGPALRSRPSWRGPALRSRTGTAGLFLRSRTTQGRSAFLRCPSPPGRAGLNPACPPVLALGSFVFRRSSNPPDPEVLCFASQSPGTLSFSSGQDNESSSASRPADLSASSSLSRGHVGLSCLSRPRRARVRRSLLPEFNALSPASPGEQDQMESMSSPTSPGVPQGIDIYPLG